LLKGRGSTKKKWFLIKGKRFNQEDIKVLPRNKEVLLRGKGLTKMKYKFCQSLKDLAKKK
jgi:hypothetical protein